jgi:hypothetical protein
MMMVKRERGNNYQIQYCQTTTGPENESSPEAQVRFSGHLLRAAYLAAQNMLLVRDFKGLLRT